MCELCCIVFLCCKADAHLWPLASTIQRDSVERGVATLASTAAAYTAATTSAERYMLCCMSPDDDKTKNTYGTKK